MNASTAVFKKSGTNFAWAFWGLEKSKKDALKALYAFCRTVDDIVDEATSVEQAKAALNRWRSFLDRIALPSSFDSRTAWELSKAVQKFPVQVADLMWIIEGVETDLVKNRYHTFEELLDYCDGVASAVGLATLAILGADRAATSTYAFCTGRALQLTNILRDVGGDGAQNRLYLPKEDLDRFGVTDRSVLAGIYSDRFAAMMKFQHDRAVKFYEGAENALSLGERKKYPSAELMRKLYRALLRQIEMRQFNVFSRKLKVSRPKKLKIALSVWVPHFLRSEFLKQP